MLALLAQVTDSNVPEVVTDPDNQLLVVLVGVVIPIITAVVARWTAAPGVKAVITLTLSAVAGVVTQAIEGGGIWTSEMIVNAVVAYVIAIATYYGLWKPTTVAPAISQRVPGFIGGRGTSGP